MKALAVVDLGRTRYREVWELQRRLVRLRVDGLIPDLLLLTEHHHVYTIGKSGNDQHLLAPERELSEQGIEVLHVDRGGDVTYHGPGQLVGYPIIDLHVHYLDVHRYLRDIEAVIIRALAAYGVHARRDERYTGVWVGGDKIAAIGVKISRWVTMHGFALNVNTDLTYYQRIIPCGIFDRGVTSLAEVLGRKVPLESISVVVQHAFTDVFGYDVLRNGNLSGITPIVHSTEGYPWQLAGSQ